MRETLLIRAREIPSWPWEHAEGERRACQRPFAARSFRRSVSDGITRR